MVSGFGILFRRARALEGVGSGRRVMFGLLVCRKLVVMKGMERYTLGMICLVAMRREGDLPLVDEPSDNLADTRDGAKSFC